VVDPLKDSKVVDPLKDRKWWIHLISKSGAST